MGALMLKLKPGVRLNGVQAPMVLGALVVASVFAARGFDCVITAATDGQHKPGSLHYCGLALDFRTRHVGGNPVLAELVDAIKAALGPEFDVVLEATHLHVEYDA